MKSYSFFDFDGTLMRGDSIVLFLKFALKAKKCSIWFFFRAMLAGLLWLMGLYSEVRSKEAALRFLSRLSEEERSRLAYDFATEVLIPGLFPKGIEEIRRKHAQGDRIVIVSASPGFYLEQLSAVLPVDRILATEYDFHTARIIGKNCKGDAKVEVIHRMLAESGDEIDYEHSSAYGDSRSDAPMMMLCRHKYGVDPKKELLKHFKTDPDFHTENWD